MRRIKFLLLPALVTGISFLSCTKDESYITGNDPFNNGTKTRTEIVVISDLHMGADLTYAEINNNLKPLESFLGKVKRSPYIKELVIAGDLFDEWFVPADEDTYDGKDQADFVKRIAVANKGAVDLLKAVIQEGKIRVTYVPGNHDLTITAANIDLVFPGINQARDAQPGLGTYTPADFPELAIEHGHRYNFFCAPDMYSNQDIAPGTILPPGYFFTRVAALHIKEHCTANSDVIKTVTPDNSGDPAQELLYAYWGVWKWTLELLPIAEYFNEKIIITNVNGFTGNYSVNDLLPYQDEPGGQIAVNLFNGIHDSWEARQTSNLVAVHIPVEHAIANAGSNDEVDAQAINQYFRNPDSDKRIVVFGHNHRASLIQAYNTEGQKSLYANSGTWIDSNQTFPTATFVVITPQEEAASSLTRVEVYSYEEEIYTKLAMNTLRL